MKKETYEHAEVEVIEFLTEDVLLSSSDACGCAIETNEKEI